MVSKQLLAYPTILASLLTTSPFVSASSYLRPTQTANRRLTTSAECTLLVVAGTRELGNTDFDEEEIFECEMDADDEGGIPGLSLPIQASDAQKKALKDKLKSGDLVPGESTLIHGQVPFDIDGVRLPPGLEISIGKENKKKKKNTQKNRSLAVITGTKPILVVKVTDSVGKARSESAATVGDDIFGTLGDPLNLKSQMTACSFGQLNIIPGSVDDLQHESAPGVIEVTIGVTLEGNSRSTIRNAVTTAVESKLGISLPGPYQQVMYVLEGCYQDCGWAAYAYVNGWNSVYQGAYYKQVGVQMHELGHNFNLAHSGGLDGATYTDHTCKPFVCALYFPFLLCLAW